MKVKWHRYDLGEIPRENEGLMVISKDNSIIRMLFYETRHIGYDTPVFEDMDSIIIPADKIKFWAYMTEIRKLLIMTTKPSYEITYE